MIILKNSKNKITPLGIPFISLSLRDFVAALRHPLTLAAGPLQVERPELRLRYKSLTLRDFVAALRHPSPPAAGRCKAQIKNGVQVNLTPFFLCIAESEVFETLIQHPPQ